MNEILANYFAKKENEAKENQRINRNKILLEEGLYEKEYSDKGSDDYPFYDRGKYYRKVPIEVTDQEFERILEYRKDKGEDTIPDKNGVSTALTAIAVMIFISGFVVGIFDGYGVAFDFDSMDFEEKFNWILAISSWIDTFVSGTLFLAGSEIIKLLTKIKNTNNK